jgi:glutathione S-transferase
LASVGRPIPSSTGEFVSQPNPIASSSNPSITLYELVLANGRSMSPYVWRVRYAMAHKGLEVRSAPLGFTEISGVCDGRFKTVPIIEDGTSAIGDSWDIVDYLERTYPARPLFNGAAEYAMVRFFDAWFSAEVLRRMFSVCALNIHDRARPEDRDYFRRSREARLKMSLESFVAERQARLPQLREALTPMRQQLARYPFLGGEAPNYADYIALGAFQWVGSVSDLPLLAGDDALRAWLDRGFDLYGGIGRDSRMTALVE